MLPHTPTTLITGGSGLIGQALTQALLTKGNTVRWIGRGTGATTGVQAFRWAGGAQDGPAAALDGVDHVIHLSGAGIADKRWTKARVQELIDSRTRTADLLRERAERSGHVPKAFISAAGIGYYGAVTREHLYTEEDAPGSDGIARISVAWEQAADAWSPLCRVVKLRTPMVLAAQGGALPRLAAPVRWGAGSALGSGKQWVPWVHIHDLVEAFRFAMDRTGLHGAYNICADDQPDNARLMRTIATVLGKPVLTPKVPALVLQLALGKLSSVLLHGSRADGSKLRAQGFHYRYNGLQEALAGLLAPSGTR